MLLSSCGVFVNDFYVSAEVEASGTRQSQGFQLPTMSRTNNQDMRDNVQRREEMTRYNVERN